MAKQYLITNFDDQKIQSLLKQGLLIRATFSQYNVKLLFSPVLGEDCIMSIIKTIETVDRSPKE